MDLVVSPPRSRSSRVALGPPPHYNSNSPRKRRKYVPGGPGGGGRWVEDAHMNAAPASDSRPSVPRIRPSRTPARTARPRREPPPDKPTYDSAADAAAAAVQIDGYKPREERGWEEFHPDLELDTRLVAFSANEIDGTWDGQNDDQDAPQSLMKNISHDDPAAALVLQNSPTTPHRRRPGRPPRRPESMLNGLGSPPAQKIIPLPAQNPRERLTLPKPSFREVRTFDTFEADKRAQENYVDRTMKRVGFQEGEKFDRPSSLIRFDEHVVEPDMQGAARPPMAQDGTDPGASVAASAFVQVEYDMDEQDGQWLEAYNIFRKEQEQVDAIKPAVFEVTMTLIEKEWHMLEKKIPKPNPKPPQTQRLRSSSSAAVNGETAGAGEEQDSKCAICDDGDCENTNAIVFCDGCDLAVHQECYGVPFIPEGQWLCRKCQQIGRAIPTCVFCPNTDGAFKLTAESRWAHLLCAIWIPEVTLGNLTFMEPIMEVAAVPKQRWKLVCYICNQKMGACIQCGNKNCYQAFHVTCARRAKLFLKTKSTHGGSSSLDASVLKAFCDRHVPLDWAREHDVESATAEAKAFYKSEMRGRKWADSQQSALALMPVQAPLPAELPSDMVLDDGTTATGSGGGQRKKRTQPPKNVWRLPSGAPVVPQVVAMAVEEGVVRFGMRKRREFVAEVCKYWTLKREARRGAALLKRLQLQMETFSTAEITRRDFAAMGAVGRARLERRIAFAEQLDEEMLMVRALCEEIKRREETKLKDAELLKDVVNIIYSPISALLWPIVEKAKKLSQHPTSDKPTESPEFGRKMFNDAFEDLQLKLECRTYGSVQAFSVDLGLIFRAIPGLEAVHDAMEAHNLISALSIRDDTLTSEQKETKKLAKRIEKALYPLLVEAMQRETELIHGKPFERELKHLESMWSNNTDQPGMLQRLSLQPLKEDLDTDELPVGENPEQAMVSPPATATADMVMDNVQSAEDQSNFETANSDQVKNLPVHLSPSSKGSSNSSTHGCNHQDSSLGPNLGPIEPLTPPRSEKELGPTRVEGGIPWYLEGFGPSGITVHDESYDGLKVRREMSEELSDMDEEELKGLGVGTNEIAEATETILIEPEVVQVSNKASARKRKKYKGFHR